MRDGVLAVSGKLDLKMGGRPVELFNPKSLSTRRTVYGYVDRYDLDATYRTFDFPSPDISAPMRPITTVPQQALFMMNSPFLLDQARRLADRPDLPPATASTPGSPGSTSNSSAAPPSPTRSRSATGSWKAAPRPKGPTDPPPGKNMPRFSADQRIRIC